MMILVSGASYQGKSEFARCKLCPQGTREIEGSTCSTVLTDLGAEIKTDPNAVLFLHFENWVKRYLAAGGVLPELSIALEKAARGKLLIIVVEDCGSGVVPMDRDLRHYREALGAILQDLSQASKRVYRVFAGLAIVLKDEVADV